MQLKNFVKFKTHNLYIKEIKYKTLRNTVFMKQKKYFKKQK